MSEFGISCIGVDISKVAIDYAKELNPNCKFKVINSENLIFDDQYFDFSISIHCLDSMDNLLTNKIMSELIRVTKKYIFITLISSHELNDINFDGKIVVTTEHEKDTIQNYFTYDKIKNLVKNTDFKIKSCELIINKDLIRNKESGRFYIIFERIDK